MKNNIIFPEPNAEGYANIVQSARKDHKCSCCKKQIAKGDTYISVHIAICDGAMWRSNALCVECYQSAISKKLQLEGVYLEDLQKSADASLQKLPNTSKLEDACRRQIKVVYEASDGETFSSIDKAIEHEKIAAAQELIMYNYEGKVTLTVENALAVYIGNDAALELFLKMCEKEIAKDCGKTYISAGIDRDTFSPGFYVWDSNDLKYIFIDPNSLLALRGLVLHKVEK